MITFWLFKEKTKIFEANFPHLPRIGEHVHHNGFGYTVKEVLHKVVTKNTVSIKVFLEPWPVKLPAPKEPDTDWVDPGGIADERK